MSNQDIIDRLDEILELLAPGRDHGRGGLTEPRRRTIERAVKALRDELLKSSD